MSITTSYVRLTNAEFELLQHDDAAAREFFGRSTPDTNLVRWITSRSASGRWLNIEKTGPGVHFLLTADADMDNNEVAAPFSYATIGGTDTKWPAAYGCISYLSPKQVRQVAVAFEPLDDQQLRERYDAAAFRAEDIYPGQEVWDILPPFVKTFFQGV